MSVRIDDTACCRCMVCVEDCPNEALLETIQGVSVVDDDCLDCGICIEGCGSSAISFALGVESAERPDERGLTRHP